MMVVLPHLQTVEAACRTQTPTSLPTRQAVPLLHSQISFQQLFTQLPLSLRMPLDLNFSMLFLQILLFQFSWKKLRVIYFYCLSVQPGKSLSQGLGAGVGTMKSSSLCDMHSLGTKCSVRGGSRLRSSQLASSSMKPPLHELGRMTEPQYSQCAVPKLERLFHQ